MHIFFFIVIVVVHVKEKKNIFLNGNRTHLFWITFNQNRIDCFCLVSSVLNLFATVKIVIKEKLLVQADIMIPHA